MGFSSLISGIFGGIIGFFVGGGPVGAAKGFAIGFGMSVAMNALAPDMPSPGQPQTAELAFPTTQEGANIPDILGTTKLSGNIFQYFGNRYVEVKEDSGGGGCGGGGGGGDVVTGYKYYLSWSMGICLGPVDTLYAIYAGDILVWSGELNRPDSGGLETFVVGISGDKAGTMFEIPASEEDSPLVGTVYFYFGTTDQAINTTMQGEISNTPAYRGLCYAFFDDCYIGDYNRLPPVKFIIGKFPQLTFNENEIINTYDYNPAHALWYIMTNDLMAGLPEEYVDETTFSDVADTLLAEERGISILFDRQQTMLSYVETILNHVSGMMRYGCSGDLADE